MTELRNQLYETALSTGIPIISGEKCCQILAYLYVYGGANEQVIYNDRLRNAIFYAQKRLNIEGGENFNTELAEKMKEYIKSIADHYNPPEWVIELENEYGIKPQRKKMFGGIP